MGLNLCLENCPFHFSQDTYLFYPQPKSTKAPAFTIEGPAEVTKNSPVVWVITMTLYDMYNNITMLVEPNPNHVKMIKLVRAHVASVGKISSSRFNTW
jgi:hypothetical protein